MTDNVVPGTFTPNYTSKKRVTRPPMCTHSGSSFHRPRAIASLSRRRSSPARIPDWELEEGKLRPWHLASCRRIVVSTPRSMQRLPRPLVRGVVSSTASLPRALLQESRPGVVSSDSVSVSLYFICVKDPGSSPSSCWTSPSSRPDSPRSLPDSSDSVMVMSLSGVVPLVWGRRMVDGGPCGCPSPGPW